MAPRGGAADFAGLAAPYGIMTMVGTDKRMCDLMQDGVMDMRGFGMPDIVPRKRNHPPCVSH